MTKPIFSCWRKFEVKQKRQKTMLQNNPTLKSKIDQLWDKFWSGGIANPLTAIEQITYLLFMKRLDDLDLKQQADADQGFAEGTFTSRFGGVWVPPEHRFISDKKDPKAAEKERTEKEKPFEIQKETLRWSEFKRMPAEEMLTHVQTKVFPFLKDINGRESSFTHHMKNAVFIIPKPSLLVEAVKTIDEIFEEMEKDSQEKGQAFQDIQGDVYEYLLSEIATAGKNGQFRTPRHIIKLMAELVQPQLGHRIADPACGTGGFLLGAYQYMVTQLALKKGAKDLQADEDGFNRTSVSAGLTEKAKTILNESLWGYDFDSTMVRLGLMNLMMHGIDEPHVDYKDTLSKSFNEPNQYDIVMANPPFTGSIDKGDINEELSLKTTKTELLFVENYLPPAEKRRHRRHHRAPGGAVRLGQRLCGGPQNTGGALRPQGRDHHAQRRVQALRRGQHGHPDLHQGLRQDRQGHRARNRACLVL